MCYAYYIDYNVVACNETKSFIMYEKTKVFHILKFYTVAIIHVDYSAVYGQGNVFTQVQMSSLLAIAVHY